MSGMMEWVDDTDQPKMELLNAAFEGNVKKITDLLRNSVPIDSTDDDHVTALQIAAFMGNNNLVSYLIDLGASLEKCNQVGMTAFHHACREGRLAVVDTLLQRGADIYAVTYLGATGLTLAAAGGHLEVVRKLVGLKLEVSPKGSGLCPSPLTAAALCSSPQICGFLKSKGAQVDETNENLLGVSALSAVIVCSKPENSYNTMVSALLDLGADPHKPTLKRETAIQTAERLKREEILENLIDKKRMRHDMLAPQSDFRQLLLNNDLSQLREALQSKETALPDATTPLMFAVAVGSIQGVRKILELRCAVNAQEAKYGYTALMLAAFLREHDIITMLLASGATPAKTDPNTLQQTSFELYLASMEDQVAEIRKYLHPFNPTSKEKFSRSASSAMMSQLFAKDFLNILGFSKERPSDSSNMRIRDLLGNRIHSSLMDGRNQKKLVRVEQILHRTRYVTRPKKKSLDCELDVTRNLAAEYQSFTISTFYDHFNERDKDSVLESGETQAAKEYDPATQFSNEYGYRDRKQVPPSRHGYAVFHKRENSDQDRRRLRPSSYLLDGGPAMGQMRTTPRMLKKSRESLTQEDRADSPGRTSLTAYSSFPQANDYNIKKSISTSYLPAPSVFVPPHHVRLTYSHSMADKRRVVVTTDMLFSELRRRSLSKYIPMFQEEEIDGDVFLTLSSEDLRKMGAKEDNDINLILEIKTYFLNNY